MRKAKVTIDIFLWCCLFFSFLLGRYCLGLVALDCALSCHFYLLLSIFFVELVILLLFPFLFGCYRCIGFGCSGLNVFFFPVMWTVISTKKLFYVPLFSVHCKGGVVSRSFVCNFLRCVRKRDFLFRLL